MDTIEPIPHIGNENSIPPKELDVGLTLRQERERLGMSVHDVAERTKFAPRQVEALEANDFAHLPQTTFLRGFVRSYARVLQLDEVALVAALPSDKPKQAAGKTQSVNVAFPNKMMLQRINILWLAGTLGVAVVLILFLAMHYDETAKKSAVAVFEPVPLPEAEVAASAVANTEVQVVEDKSANVVEPTRKPEPAKVVEPVRKAEPVKAVEPVKKPESVKVAEPAKNPEPARVNEPIKKPEPVSIIATVPSEPAEIEAASAPAANVKPELPLEVLMRRPLHFVFSAAMFAEVIDVNGNILMSRDVPSGAEKWIGGPGRAPYAIRISKPGQAKLYYKGKAIDLSAYPPNEMAHIEVQ